MAQVTELLNAAGEFLKGLGATLAPIATIVVAIIADRKRDEPRHKTRR
ncbi:hypothetical protein [Bifidobacterium samirii]|uniref:Uncharacterized protein n=1 Tax=Bifidobacterium samirii TaxID=2306974 RepID=A0A430FUC6_9BIFI|nr:hypothetical protein [Bifidobacterium samirii]RSX56761.1 hypothetical protein D2E24_1051 [Bifidobacterium samirii]